MVTVVVDREGVMKVRDGGDVPRVTDQRARKESTRVVDEVGKNLLHEFLREFSNRG